MSNLNKRIIDEINLRALTGNLMDKCGALVTIKKQNVSVYVGPGEVLNQVLIYFLIKKFGRLNLNSGRFMPWISLS